MGWSIRAEGAGASFTATWDDRQWKAATRQMKKEARAVFQKAISGVLRKNMGDIKANLKKGDGSERQIADSLIVETGEQGQGFLGPADAVVRAGSNPIDKDGVSADPRGGKIAVYYEYGVSKFNYAQKTGWSVGKETKEGFINIHSTPVHPGFKKSLGGKGWLTAWYEQSVPKMPDAIQKAIQTAWGGR
jgi:hypothetical protein